MKETLAQRLDRLERRLERESWTVATPTMKADRYGARSRQSPHKHRHLPDVPIRATKARVERVCRVCGQYIWQGCLMTWTGVEPAGPQHLHCTDVAELKQPREREEVIAVDEVPVERAARWAAVSQGQFVKETHQ